MALASAEKIVAPTGRRVESVIPGQTAAAATSSPHKEPSVKIKE